MKTYFIQKQGSYGHGIFWIGNDTENGIRRADELADRDEDNYHDWIMYEYQDQSDPTTDAQHTEIYRAKKSIASLFAKPEDSAGEKPPLPRHGPG